VYKYLKDGIILGQINPGERIVEEKISAELQVSRSPIREAIRMLEKDGLLHVKASGGVTVVEPTVEDFKSLFECRVEMESLATYYAAQRRTPKELEKIRTHLKEMENITSSKYFTEVNDANASFHEAIVEASKNPFLIKMTTQLRGIGSFYRKAIVDKYPLHVKDVMVEHKKIFQSIVNQDEEEARLHMKQHIENDFKLFMKIVEEG